MSITTTNKQYIKYHCVKKLVLGPKGSFEPAPLLSVTNQLKVEPIKKTSNTTTP